MNDFFPFTFIPNNFIPVYNQKPPTLYSVLESIVNFEKYPRTKIIDLAKIGRTKIFNFDYPLTSNISKEDFECMILNHFIMRRIGFETVTLFSLQLNVKLNSIMPFYNKLFDSIVNWNILNDGQVIEKNGIGNKIVDNTIENKTINNSETKNISNTNSTNTTLNENKKSELPQNQLELLQDESYVSQFEINNGTNTNEIIDSSTINGMNNITNNIKNNTKDDNKYSETIKTSPSDKISIYTEFQNNIKSIYNLIFKELDDLFYQLIY